MSAFTVVHSIRWETWELSAEADRRFRRIAAIVAVPIALLALATQIWDFRTPPRPEAEFDTTQYVQLLPEKVIPPPPPAVKPAETKTPEAKPEVKPAKPEVKPEKKPEPVVPPTKSAREIAQKSGVLALSDQLADLRDKNLTPITSPQTLTSAISSKGGIGPSSGGDALAATAAAGSGGIGDKAVATAESSGDLGARRTGSVKSPLGFGTDRSRGQGGAGPGDGRSLNEVKLTFDKNAGPFYAIFNRAARENANIGRGTIRVKITIAPSGAVTSCTLISSTYNDAEFERKVVERVKLLNFGAKNVPPFTADYPIYFIPQ